MRSGIILERRFTTEIVFAPGFWSNDKSALLDLWVMRGHEFKLCHKQKPDIYVRRVEGWAYYLQVSNREPLALGNFSVTKEVLIIL